MINYSETKRGDILKLVGAGAPGYARNGDLVRVKEVFPNGVKVENKMGELCEFVYNCGAARLEATEWKQDFPADGAPDQSPAGANAERSNPGDENRS
jgi:hypothetical protein